MQERRTLEKLPLQANFYPMSSSSFLQDSLSRLTLLSAQSQAVASLHSGESHLLPQGHSCDPPLTPTPLQVSWRWSWTAGCSRTITAVWVRA